MDFNKSTAVDTCDKVESLMAFIEDENPTWADSALVWLKALRDDIDELLAAHKLV